MDTLLKKSLKSKAHHLKPVVLLGAKGLTEAVVAETNIALQSHELIKVKISGVEKQDKLNLAAELSLQLHADLVQLIGNTAVLYRKNEEKQLLAVGGQRTKRAKGAKSLKSTKSTKRARNR
jgi:RNA-binding protein